ncbi:MAG: EAL domain-containing protein [Hydrogenophilaceae bacterium]|nr:EAL domain-containing protein [Hydrogenophilaceae bacterium]
MKTVSLKTLLILFLMPLILLMGAVLFMSGLGHTRDFLQQQLQSHAQDAATALALRLAPAFAGNDMAAVTNTVDALYDSGYFLSIALDRPDGAALIAKQDVVRVEDVPGWFMNLLPIASPAGKAEVTTGWRKAAAIRIASHPGHAYRQLWQSAQATLLWTLAFCLVTAGLLAVVLNQALRPLADMERLAIQVGQGRFTRLEAPPSIRELDHIGQALDRMSISVERMLDEKTRTIDQLLEDLHHDPDTGLANRAYFQSTLEAALNDDTASCGLALLHISGLESLNARRGREAGDRLVKAVAVAVDSIAHRHNALAARLNGTQFGLLVKACNEAILLRLAETLSHSVDQLIGEIGGIGECAVHVGAARASGNDRSALLARADTALRDACLGPSGSARLAGLAAEGQQKVRRLLREAIRQSSLELVWQPVLRCADHGLVHAEAFARLSDGQGQTLPAGAFVYLAEEEGLVDSLDRLILSQAWSEQSSQQDAACAVNVSCASLAQADFINWLNSFVAEPRRLYLECVLSRTAATPAAAEALIGLKTAGFHIVLDRFVPNAEALEQMAILLPEWVKIEGGLCRHAASHPGTQVLLRSLCEYAHQLGVKVAATGIEREEDAALMCQLGMDALQGWAFGAATPSMAA